MKGIFLVLAMLAILTPLERGQDQTSKDKKPVLAVPFHTDGGPPPPKSLEDLWKVADTVVDATVRSDAQYVTFSGSVLTRHVVEVHTVYRGSAQLASGASITVQRPGGQIDRGTHIEHLVDQNFPEFRAGERYILFLRELPGGRYTPTNAEFAFETRNGTILPRGKSDFARSLRGRPVEDMIKAIRARKDGAR